MAKDSKGKELPKGITQRPDGRYMGRFQYDGDKYCLYDAELEKLMERIEDMRYELRHGIYQKEQKITVSSWFNTWIEEYKKPSVKVGTVKKLHRAGNWKEKNERHATGAHPEIIQQIIEEGRSQHADRCGSGAFWNVPTSRKERDH